MKYIPYNKTFDIYLGHSLEEQEAKEFIAKRNKEKGGIWELCSEQKFELIENPNCMPKKCSGDYKVLRINHFKFFEISCVNNPIDPTCRIR